MERGHGSRTLGSMRSRGGKERCRRACSAQSGVTQSGRRSFQPFAPALPTSTSYRPASDRPGYVHPGLRRNSRPPVAIGSPDSPAATWAAPGGRHEPRRYSFELGSHTVALKRDACRRRAERSSLHCTACDGRSTRRHTHDWSGRALLPAPNRIEVRLNPRRLSSSQYADAAGSSSGSAGPSPARHTFVPGRGRQRTRTVRRPRAAA